MYSWSRTEVVSGESFAVTGELLLLFYQQYLGLNKHKQWNSRYLPIVLRLPCHCDKGVFY